MYYRILCFDLSALHFFEHTKNKGSYAENSIDKTYQRNDKQNDASSVRCNLMTFKITRLIFKERITDGVCPHIDRFSGTGF